MAKSRYSLSKLRSAISTSHNLNEIQSLCADLSLDFDDLLLQGGRSKEGLVRELISCVNRKDQLDDLVATLLRLRPSVIHDDLIVNQEDDLRNSIFHQVRKHLMNQRYGSAFDLLEEGSSFDDSDQPERYLLLGIAYLAGRSASKILPSQIRNIEKCLRRALTGTLKFKTFALLLIGIIKCDYYPENGVVDTWHPYLYEIIHELYNVTFDEEDRALFVCIRPTRKAINLFPSLKRS